MHAVYLAPALINGHRQWITSEPDEPCHASIRAWIKDEQVGDTVTGPLNLDVSRKQWWTLCTSKNSIEVVVNINMIHIAPFSCCEGLFEGAAHLLSPGGIVYLYGPFFRKGQEATIGNINFDKSLRARNELWGVRVLEDVAIVARKHQFLLKEVIDMPSNNLSVLFAKV
jgi:hypothetical protein